MGQGSFGLTAEERHAYDVDGFFARERAFADDDLAELRAAAERAVATAQSSQPSGEDYFHEGNRYREAAGTTIQFEHSPGSETVRVIEPFHHLDPVLDRLIDDPRLVEPARALVGDDTVSLFTDKLNLKRPREGSRFRWHQDSPYWSHFYDEVHRLPNVMVTLDDATEANGCFRVIRGSHTRGFLPGLTDGELGPLFTDPASFDENDQVLIEVPAGSTIFFSPHTVHGSRPNTSDSLRRAFVITYQPGAARMFKVDAKRVAGRLSDRSVE
jgi:hypothetical protein